MMAVVSTVLPIIPSLELDNETLPKEAYAFILPFWVEKASFKLKISIMFLQSLRGYWDLTDNTFSLIVDKQRDLVASSVFPFLF